MNSAVSARGRIISRALVVIGAFLAMAPYGCPRINRNSFITDKPQHDKYQVVVTTPDGKPVKGAAICLDYDPVADYEPAKFHSGEDGKVSIPTATPRRQDGRVVGRAQNRRQSLLPQEGAQGRALTPEHEASAAQAVVSS